MDTLQNQVLEEIAALLEDNPDLAEGLDLEKFINDKIPKIAESIKKRLIDSSIEMLSTQRHETSQFITRNVQKWTKGIDLLEILIVICTEVGADFNRSRRPQAFEENDYVFDIVVRHHAWACQIAQEILCLLKNGFADAAHARWRVLHELNATSMFIAKHGNDCASRFYEHVVVDSYHGMLEHRKYESRLKAKGPNDLEIANCKVYYDKLILKYGQSYSDNYGWASFLFPNRNRVTFTAIEKDVGLDHMRPYYKWASQSIHSGSLAMRKKLGLGETEGRVLLVGRSQSGMTDPAHAMAISLMQITSTLLLLESTIDHIVIIKIIQELSDEIGKTFLDINNS
jgi:hypothetical protein